MGLIPKMIVFYSYMEKGSGECSSLVVVLLVLLLLAVILKILLYIY